MPGKCVYTLMGNLHDWIMLNPHVIETYNLNELSNQIKVHPYCYDLYYTTDLNIDRGADCGDLSLIHDMPVLWYCVAMRSLE